MPKISEIFWSAQGEGVHSGYPAVFIRLSGCSLRCSYCDSRASWRRGRSMRPDAIAAAVAEKISAFPRSRLVITGGEPLEQDLHALVAKLKLKGYFIAVETNGLHFQDLPLDWWTVSPKDAAAFRVHPRLWDRAGEFKLLVTPALDLAVLKKIRERTAAPIVLQPERHDRDRYRRTFAFFKSCAEQGLADVRLGLQLHTVYRIP
jgi:organic radical activating enzyme